MDKFESQSGAHVKEGHEGSDISIRGIVLFGVFLAGGGVVSFLLMWGMIVWMENYETTHTAKLTPMEQQLQHERETPKEGLGKVIPTSEGEVKPAPDWFGRGKMDDHLHQTFKAPRLQYDDEHDMGLFRGSEDEWLKSTGKDSDGNIHIPIDRAMAILAKDGMPPVSGPFLPANVGAVSAQYPTGASDSGQNARPNSPGGNKK